MGFLSRGLSSVILREDHFESNPKAFIPWLWLELVMVLFGMLLSHR